MNLPVWWLIGMTAGGWLVFIGLPSWPRAGGREIDASRLVAHGSTSRRNQPDDQPGWPMRRWIAPVRTVRTTGLSTIGDIGR